MDGRAGAGFANMGVKSLLQPHLFASASVDPGLVAE
jgi:hypothetical protein